MMTHAQQLAEMKKRIELLERAQKEALLAKYEDHQPLERQVRTMAREGLIIDSQTLWDQLQRVAS